MTSGGGRYQRKERIVELEEAKAIATIVEKLKERAAASPWVPLGVPPRQHYHVFPNGLSICFTLDILPETKYWHLSIARLPGGPTREEVELWRRAFFAEDPTIELSGQLPGFLSRHFYWRYDGTRKS
jgi:hypothetical protein